MKLLGTDRLDDFCKEHADCRKWIANWIADVREQHWQSGHDIKHGYASASFLSNNIVVFNVRGNDYRLETQIAHRTGIVMVKWIGTHAEYTKRHR